MSYYIHTVVITLIILGLVYAFRKWIPTNWKLISLQKTENFNGKYGNVCVECDSKTLGQCLECTDCGFCINDFWSGCVKGDVHGPYSGTCKKWYHNDPFTRAELSNDNDSQFANEPIMDVPRAFGRRSYI